MPGRSSLPSPRSPRRLPRRWGIALFIVLGLFAYRWLGNRTVPTDAPTAPVVVAELEESAPSAGARRDLGADDRAGGHTLARHVGKSDAELAERLRRERSIGAASTFDDRATAERVVGATLEREARRIAAWLERRGEDLALDYRGVAGEPVGRVLLRGARAPIAAADARVVLRRRGDGYYVLTAYPLE